MRYLLLSFCVALSFLATAQSMPTLFETSKGTQTPTYPEVIRWWQRMDAASPIVQMKAAGPSDAGYPLHLVLVSGDKDFNIASLKRKQRNIIFVLNGIHPGEPDGIDASMLLVRDIVAGKLKLSANIVLAVVPVYNIGGALNRSANYRVDQNGPDEFGFRGNSQNLDLNRDFIKLDSKEATTFTRIFHELDPDVFIDNHVSNGADYQHVMTLIASQYNKLGGVMGKYLKETFVPALFADMQKRGFDLVPYVNHFGETPEQGWSMFWDSPRYSSGYASLWHSFAFVPETHMLKPYAQRVAATKALMESFIQFTATNGKQITQLRKQQQEAYAQIKDLPIKWTLDTTQKSLITFKGYTSGKKSSAVSGLPRLYYDREKPFTRQVPFYDFYRDTARVTAPKAYVLPKGWVKVVERLQANGVQLVPLKKDSMIEVESYRILSYQASPRPFEGHHLNGKVQTEKQVKKILFHTGDYLIPLNQPAWHFLVQTLEPEAEDSYFAWNFFDPVLGQKEGFSDYMFEDTAAAYLASHPEVKALLEERKKKDPEFAKSAAAQLDFVYKNSPWYEPAHLQYPVYRVAN
ncbi:Zinc carboxypeptidase [Cnuella takakiae]|uniref:Zinc carboxypeptidase n=2 Tax=Cnuella takakiae TaxID=1302690 RepID=A0A1M5I8G5_9BACT|nr:hypothetical protein BUE76_15975 [Cnuella takakiae]SHG24565.1 Zinc carboxypeptidase [Cnuella takakiae]